MRLQKSNVDRGVLRGVVAGCLLIGAGHAQADTPVDVSSEATQSSAAPAAAGTEAVGEVIVTAQRRSENLEKVPIAITVVNGDALKANNFSSITDAQFLSPSLKYTPTPFASSFSIRGVGSQAYDYSVEQSVGVSLDDVIEGIPRTLALNTLADIDHIEVLRGPQGTLFGKNTSSGLISIITRKPVMGEYSMEGHVQAGSRDEVQGYDIINVPLGDTLAARFRAAYQRTNAIVDNLSTGNVPNNRDIALNGKLLWEPSGGLSVYAIFDYQDSHGDPGYFTLRNYGTGTTAPTVGNQFIQTTTSALGIVPGPTNRQIALDGNNYLRTEAYSGQVTATVDIGASTLTAISAYKHQTYSFDLDSDSSPLTVLDNNIGSFRAHQLTQEIRLASPTGHTVEYVVGGYFYHLNIGALQQQSGGFGFLPSGDPIDLASPPGLTHYDVAVTNLAAFGEMTYRPTDTVRIIGGARYTHDDINSGAFVSEIPGVCGFEYFGGICHATPLPTTPISGNTKHGAGTGRAGVQWDLTPLVMSYFTVSRGYKGAGIATVSGSLRDIKPETVWSEEIGLKSQFLDRKVTVNAAIFHTKYHDFQAQVFDPTVPPVGTFLTGNAGGLRTQGVELEGTVYPLEGLSFSGGAAYTDAKFTDYQPACYVGQTAAQGCTLPGPTFNAAGLPLTNAPKWSFDLSGTYETPEYNGFKGFVSSNYSYRSSVYFGIGDPNTIQKAYGIWNLSLGVGDAKGRARVSLFAQNLLNTHFASSIFGTFFDNGGYSQVLSDQAFRRIGVSVDFRF